MISPTWLAGVIGIAWAGSLSIQQGLVTAQTVVDSGRQAPGVASAVQPEIRLSVDTGAPGAKVVVTGVGFPAGEIVALYLDSPGPYLDVPGPRADAQGGFTLTVTIPSAANGQHSLCGDTAYPGSSQQTAAKACAPFTVFGSRSSTPTPTPAAAASQPSGASLPELLVLAVILIVVVVGTVAWIRRAD